MDKKIRATSLACNSYSTLRRCNLWSALRKPITFATSYSYTNIILTLFLNVNICFDLSLSLIFSFLASNMSDFSCFFSVQRNY